MEENKLTLLFREHKVNVSEMSRRTGIPYGTLYDISRGKSQFDRISIGTFIKIANFFGLTADELLGDVNADMNRFDLCDIYDSVTFDGRRALLASARGIYDEYYCDPDKNVYPDEVLEAIHGTEL